jgi:1-deoxy-D-xylulose-5-phosphate synthase
MEENVINGGFGEHVMRCMSEANCTVPVLPIAIPDAYVEHGNVDILCCEIGIDAGSITTRIEEKCKELGIGKDAED